MTFQKGQGRIGGSVKGQKYQTSPGYNGVQKWAKKHGPVEPKNTPGPQTDCLCGKRFDSSRGRDVHIGRMQKLSSMVLNIREQVIAEKYNPADPNQGSY